jgi:hypothetical protein
MNLLPSPARNFLKFNGGSKPSSVVGHAANYISLTIKKHERTTGGSQKLGWKNLG